MITTAMKKELRDLGYTPRDIDVLDPRRAAHIIKLRIYRPARGMPRRWRSRSLISPLGQLRDCGLQLIRALSPSALVAAALVLVFSLTRMDMDYSFHTAKAKKVMKTPKPSSSRRSAMASPDGRLWLDVQIDRAVVFIADGAERMRDTITASPYLPGFLRAKSSK